MERSTQEEDKDERLLDGLRRDDGEAMAAVYDAYSGIAFALAYRVTGEASDAADVVQEAFLAVWRQAPRIDLRRGSLRTYLLTIVHRRAVDAARRRGRRPSISLERWEQTPSSFDLFEHGERSEAREAIRRGLDDLPAEQRRALELAYFGGLTVSELARETGVPLGTAKARLRLALKRLRQSLTRLVAE